MSQPAFTQADLRSLAPPVVGNYKSYQQYLRDFELYTKFRAGIFSKLTEQQKPKKKKTPPVIIGPGKHITLVYPGGEKKETVELTRGNVTMDDIKRDFPTATNAYASATPEQLAAKRGRKKAKRTRQRERRKALALKSKKLELESLKIDARIKSIETRAAASVGVTNTTVRSTLRRQTGEFVRKSVVTREESVRDKVPFHGPQTTKPWTPRDAAGIVISPDPSQISTSAWTALLDERGPAAREKRRVLRLAYEQKSAAREMLLRFQPAPPPPAGPETRVRRDEPSGAPSRASAPRGRDNSRGSWRTKQP